MKEVEKLYHYQVKIYKVEDSFHKNVFINEEVEVAVQNENYVIADDFFFTKIDKKINTYSTCLNKPDFQLRTDGSVLGDGLFYELYSTTKKRPETIRKECENYLSEKIGFLRGIDLDIIK